MILSNVTTGSSTLNGSTGSLSRQPTSSVTTSSSSSGPQTNGTSTYLGESVPNGMSVHMTTSASLPELIEKSIKCSPAIVTTSNSACELKSHLHNGSPTTLGIRSALTTNSTNTTSAFHNSTQPTTTSSTSASDSIAETKIDTKTSPTSSTTTTSKKFELNVSNVVCSFSTHCHLNLRKIAMQGMNVEYKKENGNLNMRLRRPYTTATLWSSGKMTCVGAKSETDAYKAARRYCRLLQRMQFKVKFTNYRVVNVLATCAMPFSIDINRLAQNYEKECTYLPELHPGATFKLKEFRSTLKLFTSGSITLSAQSVKLANDAIEHIYPILYKFRYKDSQELEQLRLEQQQQQQLEQQAKQKQLEQTQLEQHQNQNTFYNNHNNINSNSNTNSYHIAAGNIYGNSMYNNSTTGDFHTSSTISNSGIHMPYSNPLGNSYSSHDLFHNSNGSASTSGLVSHDLFENDLFSSSHTHPQPHHSNLLNGSNYSLSSSSSLLDQISHHNHNHGTTSHQASASYHHTSSTSTSSYTNFILNNQSPSYLFHSSSTIHQSSQPNSTSSFWQNETNLANDNLDDFLS